MAAEQTPLTWLLRKRTPGKAWSEWIVCGKADFDAIKAQPLNWGMEYEAVAVVALADAEPVGWLDSFGELHKRREDAWDGDPDSTPPRPVYDRQPAGMGGTDGR